MGFIIARAINHAAVEQCYKKRIIARGKVSLLPFIAARVQCTFQLFTKSSLVQGTLQHCNFPTQSNFEKDEQPWE